MRGQEEGEEGAGEREGRTIGEKGEGGREKEDKFGQAKRVSLEEGRRETRGGRGGKEKDRGRGLSLVANQR